VDFVAPRLGLSQARSEFGHELRVFLGRSELAMRPLFHQLEKRVKAHVPVAFLGYALLITLKHLLNRSASEYSPAKALKRLSELHSVDIVLPTVEGREIWLHRITKPDEDQQRIFHPAPTTTAGTTGPHPDSKM
jgi:hypothetical protein